jgi:hypothetical protein
MHFDYIWKDMCSREAKVFFSSLSPLLYFGRFYIFHFKPKWRFVNKCGGWFARERAMEEPLNLGGEK